MALSPTENEAIDRVVDILDPEMRILFVTGAGLSADSGLPTYRGVGGLYNGRTTAEGMPIEQALSGEMMDARPDLTWKYLDEIGRACRGAECNRGHRVIAEMGGHFAGVWVLTQNVDGFHRRAGSAHVIDIHGDMRRLICSKPSCDWEGDAETFPMADLPPQCPKCAEVIRPDVVLFGEMLDRRKLATLDRETESGFDLVFAVGTSALFPYVIEPIMLAHKAGVPTVEINPDETDLADIIAIKITSGAAETLDAIWTRYQARRQPA